MALSSPDEPVQMRRELSPGSHAVLTDAFAELHEASCEAERLLAEAIDEHGAHKVAASLGLSPQTALRWSRGKVSRLPATVLDSLLAAAPA